MRGGAGCIGNVLLEKSRSPVVPSARGCVRRRGGSRFHLRLGCGLFFGCVFIVAARVAPDLLKLHEGQGPRGSAGRAQPR